MPFYLVNNESKYQVRERLSFWIIPPNMNRRHFMRYTCKEYIRAIDVYRECKTSFKRTSRSSTSDIAMESPSSPLKLVNFTSDGIITSRLYVQSFLR